MGKKISIILIFLFLVTGNVSFSKEASDSNVQSQTKAVNAMDTIFTQPEEKQSEQSDADKNNPVSKKKNFFSFLKINTHKKAEKEIKPEIQEKQSSSENEKTEKIVNKKLERVKESKGQSSKGEVKVNLGEKSSDPTVVQGSVTTNKIISIDDCVKMALANHPAIKSAMSSTDIYKSKIAQAWSAYFPTFGLDANYSRNDSLISNFAFPNQKYGMYNTPRVTAQTLLFDFGKTKSLADISNKTYEASQDNLQLSINEVIFNVKKAYFNLLFTLQQEEVLSQTVKDFELHLKQAQAFYDIGTKAKIDVMTAEYNLGKAKLNYIKAKNAVALAYADINNAMGLPEYCNYTIVDKLESRAYKVDFNEIIKTAYGTRPELLAAKKKSEGSEILVKASIRAFTPDVVGFGNYTLGGKTPAYDHGYQLGAGLTYNTTNLFLLKKKVDEAKATYKKDLADYETTKQKVYLDVKQAYIDLYNAQDSIPVAKLSMKQAKEQYNLASGRYKVGLGDAIEIKDAENTYRSAQLDYYNTLLNYNVAAANLERVIGSPVKPSDESLL